MDFMAFDTQYVCTAVMKNMIVGYNPQTGEYCQLDFRTVQTIGMNAAELGDHPHMVPGESLDRPPNYGRLIQRPFDPNNPDQVQPIGRSFSAIASSPHTTQYHLHDGVRKDMQKEAARAQEAEVYQATKERILREAAEAEAVRQQKQMAGVMFG